MLKANTAAVGTPLPRLHPRLRELDRLRRRSPMFDAVIDEIDGREIRVGRHWLADFASCNYLGLDLDPQVAGAITEQIARWGTHPSWSRLLGSPRLYVEIEQRLTQLLGAPDTLLLPTVTLIHASVIPALAGKGTVLVDRNAHRSIYDGCTYARGQGAGLHSYTDMESLVNLLRAFAGRGPLLVCTDGVDSMTGNPADVTTLAGLCRDHGALLYLDDAHGFGVLGERRPDESCPYGSRGNSVLRHFDESYDNVVLVGAFSKAYSSLLAFIALPTALKEQLKITAAPYLYSGPSPVASLATVLAGFDVNDDRGDALRARLYGLSSRVLAHVRQLGLVTANTSGLPIIELPLAPGRDLATVARLLWRRRVYVTLAPYPLVPVDRTGFRVQLTAANTDEQVDRLNNVLTELAEAGDLARADAPPRPASRIPRQRRPVD